MVAFGGVYLHYTHHTRCLFCRSQDGRGKKTENLECVTSETIILFEITLRQTSLSFKKTFLLRPENINVKWGSRHNTRVIALSRLSHTSVLPSSSQFLPSCCVNLLLGSFSIDHGDGSEKVTYKMNSRFSKLCRVYSNSLKKFEM